MKRRLANSSSWWRDQVRSLTKWRSNRASCGPQEIRRVQTRCWHQARWRHLQQLGLDLTLLQHADAL